jgi:selenocysteine lyase/cysteine desulfurase
MHPPPALDCQRDLFDLPRDVAWLNAAAFGPIPRSVRLAGEAGAAVKAEPWRIDPSDAPAERVRAAAAALIGARADDIALAGAVSHAMATAARNLPLAPGTRILHLAREHASNVLPFVQEAAAAGAGVEAVDRRPGETWTEAVLAAIGRPGAPPLALAALSPLHWTDGARLDLDRIAPALRDAGAALVVDATQAAGAMPLDVGAWRPDFLAFPTYKWLLGSYNLAFLYAAPHRQQGRPIEPNGTNMPGGAPAPGARRYEMGERNNLVTLPMAEAAFALLGRWGIPAVAARLGWLTARLAEAVRGLGLPVPDAAARAGHILGLRLPGGLPGGLPGDLVARLAAAGVHVADRQGVLRIAPHVYNDEADIARFAAALRTALAALPLRQTVT